MIVCKCRSDGEDKKFDLIFRGGGGGPSKKSPHLKHQGEKEKNL